MSDSFLLKTPELVTDSGDNSSSNTPAAILDKPKLSALGRRFTAEGADPFDAVEWGMRDLQITNQAGNAVFEGKDLEFPVEWSNNCANLVAEKYFRVVAAGKKETSVKQMLSRVASTITKWGVHFGHLESTAQASIFKDELIAILLSQKAWFNSPVWFNIGTKGGKLREEPASACFILGLDDNMESILDLTKTEGMLFKGGSGSGVNYSNLRSSKEALSVGGFSSGPVPFLQAHDSMAGSIKSGGSTRRASRISILDADHGDILDFINSKVTAENAARALIDSGIFSGDFRDQKGAYAMVPFQNANHSVRVTDGFMQAVRNDANWNLLARDKKTVLETVKAKKIFDAICEAAYECGDPGLQFDTTANEWHTVPADGRINGSNPCAEFVHVNFTSCNLASINLLKFLDENNTIDTLAYMHTVDVMTTAMEILVDGAKYPNEEIRANTSKLRPLGLGFTNLGAFLMSQGIAYDSDEARFQAAMLTSILTATAYARSAKIASTMGPFAGFASNRQSMLRVMHKHNHALRGTILAEEKIDLYHYAVNAWDLCLDLGEAYGYRNAQISVLAPCGTISFAMDCDTTGIEPELGLVKSKKLVGGGKLKLVNRSVQKALETLGYSKDAEELSKYILKHNSVVGSDLDPTHYPVFDTSFAENVGNRFLSPEAHIKMVAAVQPFLSGAVSFTTNVPNDFSAEDIGNLYMQAWDAGLKSVTVYRDGCKRSQPLETTLQSEKRLAGRNQLPIDCVATRHKFKIGNHSGFVHVGLYPDGRPGEVFIRMAKEGSTTSGLMDCIGVLTSIALQYGVPLEVLVEKFSYTQFEPSGFTQNDKIQFAKSPLDYLFRWLGATYNGMDKTEKLVKAVPVTTGNFCPQCDNELQQAGACLACSVCGFSGGCG